MNWRRELTVILGAVLFVVVAVGVVYSVWCVVNGC
jgi:hypothetical protein